MLIEMASRAVQHMQKALEQMNLKLTEVVSEITGQTWLANAIRRYWRSTATGGASMIRPRWCEP
jgi:hypothetical protein